MNNLVVVGVSPGNSGSGPLPPDSPSGRRVATALGLDDDEYMARVDRIDLYAFDRPRDEDRGAGRNLGPILRGRRVLLLGRRVADAMGHTAEWFEWRLSPAGFVGAAVPHPSGVSRWWNTPANQAQYRDFLRGSLKPCIYLEGPDGTGKTTLLKVLSERLGLVPVPTDNPPKSWDECLARIERRIVPGIVCDRSSGLLSELVYAPVLRNGTLTDESRMWDILSSLRGSVDFVYCTSPRPLSIGSRSDEDPAHVLAVNQKWDLLRSKYDEVFERMQRAGFRIVEYDWTRDDPGRIARYLLRRGRGE